ncbi:unnamed protein product [Orchesella dallaii]|uniref:Uncharacterized protein n=1 Tax=Orchesella dallaii TaxID=48710 RepID=A0ABP1R4Z9_9HEXA
MYSFNSTDPNQTSGSQLSSNGKYNGQSKILFQAPTEKSFAHGENGSATLYRTPKPPQQPPIPSQTNSYQQGHTQNSTTTFVYHSAWAKAVQSRSIIHRLYPQNTYHYQQESGLSAPQFQQHPTSSSSRQLDTGLAATPSTTYNIPPNCFYDGPIMTSTPYYHHSTGFEDDRIQVSYSSNNYDSF